MIIILQVKEIRDDMISESRASDRGKKEKGIMWKGEVVTQAQKKSKKITYEINKV